MNSHEPPTSHIRKMLYLIILGSIEHPCKIYQNPIKLIWAKTFCLSVRSLHRYIFVTSPWLVVGILSPSVLPVIYKLQTCLVFLNTSMKKDNILLMLCNHQINKWMYDIITSLAMGLFSPPKYFVVYFVWIGSMFSTSVTWSPLFGLSSNHLWCDTYHLLL